MKKKRILVLTSTFPRWKNDTIPPFVYELEKRLVKNFDIYVLTPHDNNTKKYELMNGIKVYRFQYFWPSKMQKLCYGGGILPNLRKNKLLSVQAISLIIFELINTVKIVRTKKIDLIHVHWIIPQGLVAYLNYLIFKTPYILTAHGSDILMIKGWKFIKRLILGNAKKITVVSNEIKNEIVNSINWELKINIEVIPMGIDSKLFNPSKCDKNLRKKLNIKGQFLLSVGRLAPEKGIRYLIKAMPKVIKKFPKTTLLVIGEGNLRQDLENLTKKLYLEKNIIFLGPIQNRKLPKYYASADLFICPSPREGFGLTLVEAGMSGCSLIAVNSGGSKDIIGNNENGILLNSSNPKLISEAIIKLVKYPRLFDKKKIIKEFINKFDLKYICENYKELYINSLLT